MSGDAPHPSSVDPATMVVMQRRMVLAASHWLLAALALITALAMVFGVRPRALAQEIGVVPIETGVCFLCDASATAAATAPAAEGAVPASLLTVLVIALAWFHRIAPPSDHRGLGTSPPLLPPPRD
jgi:hypothetical protein